MYCDLEWLDLSSIFIAETRRMHRTRVCKWLYSNVDMTKYGKPLIETFKFVILNNELSEFNPFIRQLMYNEIRRECVCINKFFHAYVCYVDVFSLRDDTFGLYHSKFVSSSYITMMFLIKSKLEYLVSKYNHPLSLYSQCINVCIDSCMSSSTFKFLQQSMMRYKTRNLNNTCIRTVVEMMSRNQKYMYGYNSYNELDDITYKSKSNVLIDMIVDTRIVFSKLLLSELSKELFISLLSKRNLSSIDEDSINLLYFDNIDWKKNKELIQKISDKLEIDYNDICIIEYVIRYSSNCGMVDSLNVYTDCANIPGFRSHSSRRVAAFAPGEFVPLNPTCQYIKHMISEDIIEFIDSNRLIDPFRLACSDIFRVFSYIY